MPKALERKLKAQAKRKGLSGKSRRAFIYGTMRKTGWKPSSHASSTQRRKGK